MRGLLAQHLLPPLSVVSGVGIGEMTGRPGTGLLVGIGVGLLLATVFAFGTIRRLRRISVISEQGRSGVLDGDPPDDIRDEVDRAVYETWRLAGDSVRRKSSDHRKIEQQSFLIDRMQDGLMRVDANGTVMFANVTAGSMFGGRNPTGRSFIRVTRDHELNLALKRCLETQTDQYVTLEIPGDQRLISAYFSCLPTERPEALVVLRDITEVNRLQNLRRDFVANVSHELRTPLSTIKILTETLIELREDDRETAQFLVRIDNEVNEMTALVRDLLDLARLENEQAMLSTKPIDAGGLVRDVRERLATLAGRQGVDLRTDVPEVAIVISGDERRLHQALLNLARNAIDHTPADGVVTLGVQVDDGEVVLSVRDTGEGVAAEDLPRVWERFFKTDRARSSEGTGLGLAIVKHIAQVHGGRVTAQSTLGKGSSFAIHLPVARLDHPDVSQTADALLG